MNLLHRVLDSRLLLRYKPQLQQVLRRLSRSRRRADRARAAAFAADRNACMPFFRGPRPANGDGPLCLLASFLPLPYSLKLEGAFAATLRQHGCRVAAVCHRRDRDIIAYHRQVFGHEVILIDSYLPWVRQRAVARTVDQMLAAADVEALKAFRHANADVGMTALATATAWSSTGDLRLDDPEVVQPLRRELILCCLYQEAFAALYAQHQPQLVMAVEKGFVGTAEAYAQALNRGIDFVQWVSCHEPLSLMLKRYRRDNERSHPFSISPRTWQHFCQQPWNETIRTAVMHEFQDGYSGNKWFSYKKLITDCPMLDRDQIIARYQLDATKPTAVIFAHILNDANMFYGRDLFAGGFREWLVETVRACRDNPHLNWILKLHPANIFRRQSSGYAGEYGELLALQQDLGQVPANLHLILPEDAINPLALFRFLDYGITVRGTVGAEIPCFGKRVLTASTGRYSGLGFTDDSSSAAEYLGKIRQLHQLPQLSQEQTRLALRHAWLFFIGRPWHYNSLATDDNDANSPMRRNLHFHAEHVNELCDNAQLAALVRWLRSSAEDDYVDEQAIATLLQAESSQ